MADLHSRSWQRFSLRWRRAQTLEGVLMPGKVIAGHAKIEQDCDKCHVKFNKAAQDGLCLDCHKEVGATFARRRAITAGSRSRRAAAAIPITRGVT